MAIGFDLSNWPGSFQELRGYLDKMFANEQTAADTEKSKAAYNYAQLDETKREFDSSASFKSNTQKSLYDLLGSGPTAGYSNLLAEQKGNRDQLLGQLADYGTAQQSRINTDYGNATNSALASNEARGLGASNLQGSTAADFQARKQQSTLDLQDQLLGRRVDTAMNLNNGIYQTEGDELNRQAGRQGQLAQGLIGLWS